MTPTEIIAAHPFRPQDASTMSHNTHCGCGWYTETPAGSVDRDVHAAHVWSEITFAEPVIPQSVLEAYEAGVIHGRAEAVFLASQGKPKKPRLNIVTKSSSRPGFSCSHCGSTDPGAA